jgi:hypothetical protein
MNIGTRLVGIIDHCTGNVGCVQFVGTFSAIEHDRLSHVVVPCDGQLPALRRRHALVSFNSFGISFPLRWLARLANAHHGIVCDCVIDVWRAPAPVLRRGQNAVPIDDAAGRSTPRALTDQTSSSQLGLM